MAYDRFLIAPINSGLETDTKPWLIPDDAFSQLNNAYVYRGRVRKRFGTLWTGTGAAAGTEAFNSRVCLNLTALGAGKGVTTNAGAAAGGTVPGLKFNIGSAFVIGSDIYTVNELGVPGDLLSSRAGASGTFNTTTGAFTFTAAEPLSTIYFYPGEPIMGLTLYEQGAITEHDAYAFDTQFVYKYQAGAWTSTWFTPLWHGSNSQFFWATNWQGANTSEIRLFVTNYNAVKSGAPGANDDPIYSYNGTTWAGFYPKFIPAGTGNYVQSCRIILSFKDRLLLLNTIETDATEAANTHHPARCRFSHNGLPFPEYPTNLGPTVAGVLAGNVGAPSYGLPWKTGVLFTIDGVTYTVVSAVAGAQPMATNGPTGGGIVYTFNVATGAFNFTGAPAGDVLFFPAGGGAWIENNYPGWDGAGWIDATTDEEIIGAEFIKDRLIVYFERSTWELAYTGNQVQPFVWQKLNTELGAISTFSLIPFDKMVLGIGINGVHACNASNVERIDSKIPLKIYDLRIANDGVYRVHGIRDYPTEVVYWTFPDVSADASSSVFPNKIMLYNYSNDTWAFNDDCFTCFGYFEQSTDDTWEDYPDTEWREADFTWSSGLIQPGSRSIIAGNQQGYIVSIEPDISRNASNMQLTDALGLTLTIINHTLQNGDFIYIEDALVDNAGVISDSTLNGNIYQVFVVDADTVLAAGAVVGGTYVGRGVVARVPRVDFRTKQLNPYNKQGKNVYLAKIDFCVEKTDTGAITVDYAPSSSNLSMIADGLATGAILGNNILETSPYLTVPLENSQDQLWHAIYFQAEGTGIQLHIYMNDAQMPNPDISMNDFQLEGMVLYTQPVGRLA